VFACTAEQVSIDSLSTTGTNSTTGGESETQGESETKGESETETGSEPPPSCDMLAQDCGPGQKCVGLDEGLLGAWTGTRCAETSPEGSPPGSFCFGGGDTGWDTCGPDSMCVQLGTGEGLCFPFCGAPSEPGEVGSCAPFDGLSLNCERLDAFATVMSEPGVFLCQLDCDPLLGTCPADRFGCYPGLRRTSCIVSKLGPKPEGFACEQHLDCFSGTVCAQVEMPTPDCEGPRCCAGYCDTSEPSACEASVSGPECVALFDPLAAPVGLESVGLCL